MYRFLRATANGKLIVPEAISAPSTYILARPVAALVLVRVCTMATWLQVFAGKE